MLEPADDTLAENAENEEESLSDAEDQGIVSLLWTYICVLAALCCRLT